ncbi:hypothetical protein TNCV_2983581 [Trichonephila clavipes]|nr:hypothetical protein TNCV_2983581 [Trichonephila clavipes]
MFVFLVVLSVINLFLWTNTQHVINTPCSGSSRQRRQVAGQNYPPTNKNTLIRALTEEWDKLSQQLLDNVVQSMALLFGLLDCKNSAQSPYLDKSSTRGMASGVLHSARWHDGDWMIDGIREAWLRCFVWMVNLEKFFDLAESLVTALNNFTSVQPFLIYPSLTLLSF